MKRIRKGVFETNSSSMHSLCIHVGSDDNMQPNELDERDGFIISQFEEFGWGINTINHQEDKLAYILTTIMMKQGFYPIESKEDVELFEESHLMTLLKEVIEDYTGKELKVRYTYQEDDEEDEEFIDGYIDHESIDMLNDQLRGDDETIKENIKNIIFNGKYFILIDNDNH